MDITTLIHGMPEYAVYALLAAIVGVESIGIPLPGETALMVSTLAARSHAASFTPLGIAIACASGAIIGDSIGYWVGREWGGRLLKWMTRRFPRHVTPAHLGWARSLMDRYGAGTVFGGRFVALLRMLAGPLAGSMGMHYPTFLAANAAGGICWAGGMVTILWFAGAAAETYLKSAAWVILGIVVVAALVASRVMNSRMQKAVQEWADEHPDEMAEWEQDTKAKGRA